MVLNIQNLIDDAKCFETVRELRWPGGVTCPDCGSRNVTKQGHDDTQPQRQRYQCQACRKRFDDLTGTISLVIISRCGRGFCVCISWG